MEVRVASRGDLRRLRELAEKNAKLALAQDKLRREHRRQQRVETLSSLQEALGLERVPVRIEGFDISNLGETHTVASMVVFEGGAPKKSDYRKFNIRGEEETNGQGPDDFASMAEVLGRRLGRYMQQADISPHDSDRDASFSALPDLIVIDGGKGQLSAGLKAPGAVHRAWRGGRSAWRSESRRSSCRADRPRSSWRRARMLFASCNGSATRPTGSRSPTTGDVATRR